MLAGIKEKKWIYIKNFFSQDELNILKPHCLRKAFYANDEEIFTDTQGLGTPSFAFDPLMHDVHRNKLRKCEEVANLKLYPTYTYWRAYTYGIPLDWHLDRPSCEISITATVDSDGSSWPIYMEDTAVDIEVGDAVMYLGCDVMHGRKPFKGRYMAQVFMHYVDQEGFHKDHIYDQVNKMQRKGTLIKPELINK